MAKNQYNLCMGCMSEYSGSGKCKRCGFDPAVHINEGYLAAETVIAGRYLVGKLTTTDPEGAWYVGYDLKEETRVWVREYAPFNIITRDKNGSLMPVQHAEAQYKALLSDFEDLCASIKKLSLTEKVIPIIDQVSANNTRYAIYKYVKTLTLASFLERSGGKLSWRHAKKLLMPLFHTVSNIHKAGLIHRGLSPYTVLLDQAGSLWLSNFTIAAARTNKSELSAQLFAGYSAPEQYSLNSWQGEWTDVYALGAITYRTIKGIDPPAAMDRVYGDDLLDENDANADLTEIIVNAINHALAFEVDDRIQTAEAYISALLATEDSNTAVYTAPAGKKSDMPDDDTAHREVEYAVPVAASGRKERAPKSRNPGNNNRPKQQNQRTNSAAAAKSQHTQSRKKGKNGLPLVISLLVATLLLGGGVVFLAKHLSAWVMPSANPEVSSASEGNSQEAKPGEDFGSEDMQEKGTTPEFIGKKATSVKNNTELNEKYNIVYKEDYNSEYEEGVVYDQQPPAGNGIKDGGQINLFVSKGKKMVKMPDIVNMKTPTAYEALAALGINYEIIELSDKRLEDGVIIRTNTAAGAEVEVEGEAVILFIKSSAIGTTSSASSKDKDIVVPGNDNDQSSASKPKGNSSKASSTVTTSDDEWDARVGQDYIVGTNPDGSTYYIIPNRD